MRSIYVGFIFSCALFAQFDAGQISGFVRDATGAVVPGASVAATNEGNHEQHRKMISSPEGYYVFPQLFVGKYSVAVEASGFKKFTTTGIALDAQAQGKVDVALTVGAITEAVEVQASAAQVQTDSAEWAAWWTTSRSRTSR